MFNRILKISLGLKESILLFGPRGTGKTSWVKAHFPGALYLDLLDFSVYNLLSADPSRLANLIPPMYDGWVVIDEIQRIPELMNEVHRLIESKKYRFFLTGSSARSLKRLGVNLLAGRALRYTMHPLVVQEIGDAFNVEHALKYGMLPAAVDHQDPKRYLETYVQTYVREEVLQEGLTRNVGSFTRFLEIASFSQGNTLNVSEIARELGVSNPTVSNYFDILDDLLIAIRITPFAKRAKRKLVAHQKFFFFDAGVYRALRPTGPLDIPEEIDGAGLETLFLQSLRAINDYYDLGYSIHFWRTHAGTEVDFVLYGPRGLHAFEIKRAGKVQNKFLKGLTEFGKDYPEAKKYLVYTGALKEYHGDIVALPFVQALKDLPALLG